MDNAVIDLTEEEENVDLNGQESHENSICQEKQIEVMAEIGGEHTNENEQNEPRIGETVENTVAEGVIHIIIRIKNLK